MPEIVETTVYRIDELSEKAKARAREEYIEDVLNNVMQWYEPVFDDFEQICDILGITLENQPAKAKEPARPSTLSLCIWFRGFSNQGDGACFDGRWEHVPHTCNRIRVYAPKDERLHKIADSLASAQKQNSNELYATTKQQGRYYHEHSMRIDVERANDVELEHTEGSEETVSEALRDLARWLYRSLEARYEYETSDSIADEAILANDWKFTANGAFFTHMHGMTRSTR